MKKDNKSNIRRERIIMMTSSVFVLGALTMTGVYMRNQTKQSQDDGYTIDFDALENRAENKAKEIAKNEQAVKEETQIAEVPDSDLDYLPMEVGSNEIKIPGLTDKIENKVVDDSKSDTMSEGVGKTTEKAPVQKQPETEPEAVILEMENPPVEEVWAESPIISEELHFSPETMVKPVSGNPLIDYSMNRSVYFATLDQYKYNPAVIYAADLGEEVKACTNGKVLDIHNDSELGHVLVLDLGDGYRAVYGQLDKIEIPIGGMVNAGEKLAYVAAPTKYFSVEGSNLYFQILKDGVSVDPNSFF